MTTPASIVTFDAAMRERYTDQQVYENLLVEDNPFLAMVEKDPEFQGESEPIPFMHTAAQGHGSKLSTARANAAASEGKSFAITLGDYYAVAQIQDKAMLLTRGREGALLKIKMAEVDSLYQTHFNDMSLHCWSNGGAAVCRRGSVSGSTLTVASYDDIVNIEKNMKLVVSANDGSLSTHTLRGSGATITVTAVNYGAGTFDFTGTVSGFVDNDYLFRESEFGGTEGTRLIKGVGAWVPATDPTSTAFFGVDRTENITRMSGVRVKSTRATGSIEERCKSLIRAVKTIGAGNPKTLWMHDEQWGRLETSLEAKGNRAVNTFTVGSFGFDSLRLRTPNGTVDVYADRRCSQNVAFALDMRTWKLKSAGPLGATLNGDGLEMLRLSSGDDAAYEYALKSYPQLTCSRLPSNGRIALPAVEN